MSLDVCETVHLSGDLPDELASGMGCRVRWRRNQRARRISLRIDPQAGEVVVTLPPRAARRAGIAMLATHAAWVRERLAALAPRVALVPGAEVSLGDTPHVIRLVPGCRGPAWLEPGTIRVPGDATTVSVKVTDLLKAEARRRIGILTAGHAAVLDARPGTVKLKDTRSRWGSCAPDGTLAFTWRLVMAPDWVLDYVVAHEVAHLKEMNHSDRFWSLVAILTPHKYAAVEWLKTNGPGLLRVG